MSVLHAPRQPEVDKRLFWFPLFILPLMLLLAAKLWIFQMRDAAELVEEAERSGKTIVTKLAPRGAIFDRRGKMLAGVEQKLTVSVKPSVAKENPIIVPRLASILGMTVEEVQARIDEEKWRNLPATIKVGLDVEVAAQIAEDGELIGVELGEKPMRKYVDTIHFSHVLGYVWTPNKSVAEDLEAKGIKPAEFVGRDGIERQYEAQLMGTPGKETTERTKKTAIESEEMALPGKQLFMSLDADLQAYAQAAISQRGYKGSIVAIEPSTGEILALVSNPTYDNKLYEGGISSADYKKLQEDPDHPLINRPIQGAYAPGSTFKILTAMAAYRAGKLNTGTYITCPGYFAMGGGRKQKCMGTHGTVGFNTALKSSCNTFFSTLSVRTGRDEMVKSSLDSGFYARSGIELLGERRGVIPSEKWTNSFDPPREFYPGHLAQMGIGQGYVTTTPIQMANLMALVANEGVMYKPHLVRAIKDTTTQKVEYVQPEVAHRFTADSWFWDMLKDGMCSVINDGTAGSARINGINWGGKTGSAEHGKKGANLTHSWFVGFAPRVNPKIAICAMAESQGHGGDAAAPLAADIVRHYLLKASKTSVKRANSASN
ncbi:MAG TPA: penicillin-binding protein 2 [Fimbriimonas sp.]|nr:penicillin-binding protein 2 [Fimbriimonas sp.]